MKKATDRTKRELVTAEINLLNRRLKELAKVHKDSTVPGFMAVINAELRKRAKQRA